MIKLRRLLPLVAVLSLVCFLPGRQGAAPALAQRSAPSNASVAGAHGSQRATPARPGQASPCDSTSTDPGDSTAGQTDTGADCSMPAEIPPPSPEIDSSCNDQPDSAGCQGPVSAPPPPIGEGAGCLPDTADSTAGSNQQDQAGSGETCQLPANALPPADPAEAPSDEDTVRGGYPAKQPLLIVNVGDSFGSGEGNPDVPASHWFATGEWSGSGARTAPADEDRKCHRSSTAPAAVAATLFQNIHAQYYNVKYMSFACTGDSIGWQLSPEGYDPTSVTGGASIHLHQLDDLFQTVCPGGHTPCQKVDDLILSFGGNDLGFSQILLECMNPLNIYGCNNSGYPEHMKFQTAVDQQTLPHLYDQLQGKIKEYKARGMAIDNIWIVEYPSPLTYLDGQTFRYCGNSLGFGLDLTDNISPAEAQWAHDTVVPYLNHTLGEAAVRNGWKIVDGVYNSYLGNGYCARNRYVNNNNDARAIEGGISFTWGQASLGTMHPNKAGQAQTGLLIEGKLESEHPDSAVSNPTRTITSLPGGGGSGPSAPAAPAAPTKPTAPTGLHSDYQTTNSISVKWTNTATNATNNELAYAAQGQPGKTNPSLPSSAIGTLLENLPPGTPYNLYVRACNTLGCSSWSTGINVSTKSIVVTKPKPPSNLHSDNQTTDSISLKWTNNADNATRNVLAYAPTNLPWQFVRDIAPSSIGYLLQNLQPGNQFNVYVQACNSAGCSDWSNGLSVTSKSAPVASKPAAPSGLRSDYVTATSISLKWTNNATNATRNELAYAPTNQPWRFLSDIAPSSIGTLLQNLNPGSQFNVYVRACNSLGCSNWSNGISVSSRSQ